MSATWKCPVCETMNNDGSPRCVVCETARVGAPDAVIPGQGGRSADDPANHVPQTATLFTSAEASAPVASPSTILPAVAMTAPASTAPGPRRSGLVIALVALVGVLVVGAVAFKLGSSSTTTTATPSATTDAPTTKPLTAGTPVVSAPVTETSSAIGTVVTAPPPVETVITVTVLPPPITSPTPTPAPPPAGASAGTITGTCDEGTTCGTFVRVAPQQSAAPVSKTALQDGQTIQIVCSTTGDLRRSGSTSSSMWYELEGGGYVAAVFVFTHATIPTC